MESKIPIITTYKDSGTHSKDQTQNYMAEEGAEIQTKSIEKTLCQI
jgi:hypothetical protein